MAVPLAQADGTRLRDKQDIARILSLAIPPAWTDVWICPLPHGHLQAVGQEHTSIRVGNEEYARTNDSFGLTTLRDHHAEIAGSTVRFTFKGKSGIDHDVALSDRRVARIVAASQDLPGQELFQYLDHSGQPAEICSEDVNDYIRGISGEDFTAKDFRTYVEATLADCVICAEAQPGPHGLNQQEMAVLRLVEAYAAGPMVRSRAV